jgi:hypothetical protein
MCASYGAGVMPAVASAAGLPSVLGAMPTALAVSVLCAAVIIEIVAVPGMLLPGGTVTLLAGALIGAGRPALAVALPVVAAVFAGDQLAYFSGSAVAGWWRRRRPGRAAGAPARPGPAAAWLTAAMPSLAGGAGIGYRSFARQHRARRRDRGHCRQRRRRHEPAGCPARARHDARAGSPEGPDQYELRRAGQAVVPGTDGTHCRPAEWPLAGRLALGTASRRRPCSRA